MVKRKKRRGSSKAGRPRKEGARFPSGRLKASGPNELTLERRKLLCADITKATDPMDCALANGWITMQDHRTGMMYAALHRAAVTGGPRSGAGAGALEVTAGSQSSGVPWGLMASDEVAAIWDSAMKDVPAEEVADEARESANRRWRLASAAMTPEERAQVHLLCVQSSWPWWITNRAAAAQLKATIEAEARQPTEVELDKLARWKISIHEHKRDLLLSGLRAVRKALRPAIEPTAPESASVPYAPRSSRKVDEVTHYVDATGAPVFTAVRRVPVGGKA